MDAYSNDFKKTVLRWSVSLRYQCVYCYNTSNLLSFFYVSVRHFSNVLNRPVLLMHQSRRCDDVSVWSRTLKLFTKMSQFPLDTKPVHFSQNSSGSSSLKYQLVRRHNISNISSHLQLLTYTSCDLSVTCSVGQSHLGINCCVVMTSQTDWFYLHSNETLQRRLK